MVKVYKSIGWSYYSQYKSLKKRSFVGVIKPQKLTFKDLFACLYYN